MSFRKKIIVFVTLVSIGLLILLYAALFFVLNKNFVYLENDNVNRRLKRVNSVSEIFFNSLKSKVFDWGEWNEAYDFSIGQNDTFASSYLNDSALVNLDVNAVVFTDNEGQILGLHAYDFLTKQSDPGFGELFKGEMTDLYFRNYFLTSDFQQGIVLLPGNRPPLYLASKKVLRGDKSGPSTGYIFMGRFLDQDFVNYHFGDIALYSTVLERVDGANLDSGFLEARSRLILNENFVIVPAGPKNIYGYSLFKDYNDIPAFIFRIATDRTLYQYEINILLYVSILLLIVVLIFVLVFLWMINRIFVERLIKIVDKVEEYKKNPAANDIDIAIGGQDELSKLSKEFNGLIKEISDSRNFYKNLLIRLPDIVILTKAGRIIYANDALGAITGFTPEDVLGKNLLDFIEKDYRDLKAANMKLRFSGVDILPYTIKIITKSEPLDVRVNAKFIDFRGEKVDLIVLTDVSESIKAQKKIEEKMAELERLNHVMVNRELKMMELKKQIGNLESKK